LAGVKGRGGMKAKKKKFLADLRRGNPQISAEKKLARLA